jgi:cytochrome c biogenesis protein CcmG/thiol:disulfide interchange protein DsbE
MSRRLSLIPIILLIWVVGGFAWRLVKPVDTAVHSQMIERELPPFDLAPALAGKPGLKSADLATGKPRLLNVFASWCVPCVGEAPVLDELRRRGVEIDAIAVRDSPDAVSTFVQRYGDPYQRIGLDPQSNAQIALGSSGVPETFLIDGRGVIRRQYIGPLTAANVPEVIGQMWALK